jgi:hypothetical protein
LRPWPSDSRSRSVEALAANDEVVDRGDPRSCDERVDASFVYRHAPSNDTLLDMSACIRGPGVRRIEREVLAMPNSVTVERA